MSKTDTKNFIKGSAKEVVFENGGSLINISLNLDEINALPTSKGYVQISVIKRSDTDSYGNTHYIVENTFKPSEKSFGAKSSPAKAISKDDDDDLPF